MSLKKTLLVGCILIFSQSFAQNIQQQKAIGHMSKPILQAHVFVHKLAATSFTRSLPMFNYTYYAYGYCRNQDCSPQKIKAEIDGAKARMGAEFEKLLKNVKHYQTAIQHLQHIYRAGDLATISNGRSAQIILKLKLFITASDMTKAILYAARAYGQSEADLRYVITMVKDEYLRMCPSRDGRAPILPRPVVFAVVGYKYQNHWYFLNPENSSIDLSPIGFRLPYRLGFEVIYQYPLPMKGKTLTYAGAYEIGNFINGHHSNFFISATAAGTLDSKLTNLQCR